MASEGEMSFSVASVVEDVLRQHGSRSRDLDMDARRAEEAGIRRNEAATWLRKMVGVVGAKDLPAEPSEEEFRLGLRSGILLCNVLNKIQSGAIQKVVESPCDPALVPDGAALSAYQYFENVRNFLVAIEATGLPAFEASDFEEGGKTSRIVNCVLALKSYSEWKQAGGAGVWKFGGNLKPITSGKQFLRKNSDPFTNSLSRNLSMDDKSLTDTWIDSESNKMHVSSLSMLVRAVLLDKKPDEVPTLVESVLTKVMEECERRIFSRTEPQKRATLKNSFVSHGNKPQSSNSLHGAKVEKIVGHVKNEDCFHGNYICDEESKRKSLRQQMVFDQQQKDIEELKQTICTAKAGMQFMQMKFHEEIQNLGTHLHGLAYAASGYHRVLDENRKLYNQVQDLKGSIRVYCRVRPFLGGHSTYLSTVESIEEGTITINAQSKYGKGRRSFNFNKVFGPSATQGEVFSDTQPLIRSVLDGYNICIFAYGQTGSGKTYTMSGPKDITEKSQGVNYRALGDLFLLAEQRKDVIRYDIFVQMIEIYNEQVRDLLITDGLNRRLEIRNSSQKGLNVPDACLVRVTSTSDVIDLMTLGQRNRAVGATALNDRSSRSHSCLTIHVQGRDLTSGSILRGCMHLVDLAGSERVDKSEVTGDRLKEAQHINKSLSALGDVISSLAQKNSHVPYRNSKLTQLLQESLGGQAKTLMFVHISPELEAIGETISTLKFAERVSTVELGAARVNKDSADVKELKEQISVLKAALARKGEPECFLHTSSDNPCGMASSHFQSDAHGRAIFTNQSNHRKLMGDAHKSTVSRQKRQSLDLDELLGTSPSWPPVSSPVTNYREEDRESGSGEWIDKVMVNKQDGISGTDNPLQCWETDSERATDVFYQKVFTDPATMYPKEPYNLFSTSNQFDIATNNDDVDELDAGTSDSSEPDLLWQFNNSKLSVLNNGVGMNSKKSDPKFAEGTEFSRASIPKLGPAKPQKLKNGVGIPLRGGRQGLSINVKQKNGNRK